MFLHLTPQNSHKEKEIAFTCGKSYSSMTEIQIASALSRIGLDPKRDLTPTAELLREIQYAFCTTVPYENIDILRGIPLSLCEDALYDKIVTRRRGGYCFEINGFLAAFLRALGYTVTEYMARYLRGETEIPMRRHRVLGVETGAGEPHSRFICDAGIGQASFRYPLPFYRGAVSKQCGECYRVEKEDFFGWVISDCRKTPEGEDEWRRFYSFTEEPQLGIDYIMPSFWCEMHPDSPFRGAYMLSIKTADGRKTLDGNVYRIFSGDGVTERVLSDAEIPRILSEVFGITESISE